MERIHSVVARSFVRFSCMIAMVLWSACSDNNDGADEGDADSSTDSGSQNHGTDDSDTVNIADSESETSAISGDVLRLDALPTFQMALPSSLSKSATPSKAVVPDELDEVQSEGFYQLQEERVFSDEIYQIRGLLAFLEQYTQDNNVPEDSVVEFGIQTGVTYEGGAVDGQVMNPHLADFDAPYEGVDLGRIRWWQQGERIFVVWHLADTFFAAFPYWQIEIAPSEVQNGKQRYQVATFKPQFDGVQENHSIRYVSFDEGTNETHMYIRDVGYSLDLGGEASFVSIAMKKVLADTDTETPITQDTETDSESAAVGENVVETMVYKATGNIDVSTGAQSLTSQIAAIGNENGGGVIASTIPFELWSDDGNFVDYRYFYRELYNGQGNLISRAYSKKFDDVTELSKFSWFQPETEATNFYSLSPSEAPAVIYYRYEFDILTSQSTFAYSLASPVMDTWTSMTQEESVLRVIWKQLGNSEPWSTGDVVYEFAQADMADCSVTGETNCTIYTYRPHSIYPESIQVFDEVYYPEQQWPMKYLRAAADDTFIKIEMLDTWPYVSAWLELDENDVQDAMESAIDCHTYDVYFYTSDGNLIAASIPMLYSTQGVLPDELLYDEAVAVTAKIASDRLTEMLEVFVPAQTLIPEELMLPSEDDFLAQFELTHIDTDAADTEIDISTGSNIDTATDTDTGVELLNP